MTKDFKIGAKKIGESNPTYVIAEIGFNHEGDIELGKKMIEAAASTGADAVKFQTYKASDLAFKNSPHYDLIRHGELGFQDHIELKKIADENGVHFFSTPFSLDAVDILEEVGVPAYKVASMDVTFVPLIKKLTALDKPIFISTGMATLEEIQIAINHITHPNYALLHCISLYPPNPENVHLRTIQKLIEKFQCPIGYSDHTLNNLAALTSVALGASIIEKHFTIDKNLPGPDHKISADTAELKQMVFDLRIVEATLGQPCTDNTRSDRKESLTFRRSIYAAEDIPAGTILTHSHIKYIRPEAELAPGMDDVILGQKTNLPIAKDTAISLENFN